jgi:hypothetical protein
MGRKKLTKHETHGALPVERKQSVYEIMGFKDHNFKYKTVEDYRKYLEDLNLSDLQEHAMTMGSVPIDNRERMINKLLAEFTLKTGVLATGFTSTQDNIADGKPLSDQVKKLLQRGR